MIHQATQTPHALWQPGTDERAGLVRWCAYLTGDPVAAEDLAQEAMLIAWQGEQALRDPGKRGSWLMGIARNLCMNWSRRQARTGAGRPGFDLDQDSPGEFAAPNFDADLEREDLAILLDRALALLPAATRDILIYRYLDDAPHADIAARVGLSEGAVKVRLHRGVRALRWLLETDLRQDALAFGLDVPPTDAVRPTRIWCPCCGRHRLVGALDSFRGDLTLHCPGCGDRPPGFRSLNEGIERIKGLTSVKAALNRLLAGDPLRIALDGRAAPCRKCGRVNPVSLGLTDSLRTSSSYPYAVHIACQGCGASVDSVLQGVALGLPETLRFWRDNPRMQVLPLYEVEAAGGPAVVTRFESLAGAGKLDIVFSRATFGIIAVHGDPAT